ncbi:uncharacterized protein PG986_001413 [Apiospora aurea]|uniref:Protein Zds1 C-terminal domain-containing protein n=1 Tax=Apiospora aurea TaxID=335848 RepID=A0ABR1QWQ6_9PEZI
MMTSSRPRDAGGSFSSRRGHTNQLSISDPSHHITETIGTLYGDDDDYSQGDRPMSFIASPYGGEQIMRHEPPSPEEHRLKLVRSISDKTGGMSDSSPPSVNGNHINKSQNAPGRRPSQRNGTHENSPSSPSSPLSPTLRDMRDEGSQFPLGTMNDPNDIALELSNLQALRRMSMDVSNSQDPDLLPFQNMSLMSVAPQGDDDEADPSRLLWVPAGVHPELAPTEFKNFLEKRVQSIKRRSGDSMLSVDGLDRSDSGGLRRQKSMLSRQIDNRGGRGADGYVDGAERLERKSSTAGQAAAELSLDELMNDPSRAVQKLALQEGNSDGSSEDKPILPAVPGTGLRRSTRTTYRKGGSLKDRHGGSVSRPSFSKRIAARQSEEGGSDMTNPPIEAPPGYGLNRVQSEPIAENYSRPNRSVRRQQPFSREQPTEAYGDYQGHQESTPSRPTEFGRRASDERPQSSASTPQMSETSVIEEEPTDSQLADQHSRPFPARSSSQSNIVQPSQVVSPVPDEPPARSSRRPNYSQQIQQQQQQQAPQQPPQQQYQQAPQQPPQQPQRQTSISQQPARDHQRLPSQTLNDIAQNPAPLPGPNSGRTDSLTFIPTLPAEEKKPEKKSKKESLSKPTGWKWFKSGDDKDKKKKEEEESKKSKAKAIVEKAQDNVRLDVLQTSIDNVKQKGRESLLLDRENVDSKLEEERRKESSRKSGDAKKEKDGIFANFFGGKKKGDRDSGGKKSHARPQSPEPAPYKPMVPDVDYHWTRFPILEERAIYRMAHIKLANPRRALHSQVLLSNFMYAYLAKVQAMHPQIQVPISPQQKRLQEEERKRREQEQREQEYLEQQQAQESMDRYNFEYHRGSDSQYGDDQQHYDDGGVHDSGDYPEDAEIYDYDHGGAKDQNGGGGHQRGYSNEDRRRQQQQQQNERDDDMW